MTTTESGGDAARVQRPVPEEGTADFEVMDMHWTGMPSRWIASTMRESDFLPPPRRAWTRRTVEDIVAAYEHLSPAEVPGTWAHKAAHRAPAAPCEPLPEEIELPSAQYRRV